MSKRWMLLGIGFQRQKSVQNTPRISPPPRKKNLQNSGMFAMFAVWNCECVFAEVFEY